jgi:8-oxo-dGTP diphosphatase
MVACETDLTALTNPAAEFLAVSLPAGQEVILPAAKYTYEPGRHNVWEGNKSLLPKFTEKRPEVHPKEDELPSVAAAIVTSERGVLIARRNDGKPPWTFIAGEVEPGETAAFAAGREVKEETGIDCEHQEVIGDRVHPKTGRTATTSRRPGPAGRLDVFVGDTAEIWLSPLGRGRGGRLLPQHVRPVREYLARELGEG